MLEQLASRIDGSALQAGAVYLLSQIRGFPPMIQTVHLLAIAAVMGSIVLIDLRILGLALRGQPTSDLARRLLPWTWWALPFLFVSGIIFVLARPQRYAVNPIFRLKFVLLALAVIVTLALHRVTARNPAYWEGPGGGRVLGRMVAAASLLLWVAVVLAGRWIAYADYLLPSEE